MTLRNISALALIAILIMSMRTVGHAAPGTPDRFDFNDCTLQGWTPAPPFNGDLFAECTGGNPGGFMVATDTLSRGGPLYVQAPAPLRGDLSAFAGLQWDAFVYDNGSATRVNPSIILRGVDGTIYQSDRTLGPIARWTTAFAPFDDPTTWTRLSGAASFADVLTQVDALFIEMDTSIQANGVRESGIDNVTLVPARH